MERPAYGKLFLIQQRSNPAFLADMAKVAEEAVTDIYHCRGKSGPGYFLPFQGPVGRPVVCPNKGMFVQILIRRRLIQEPQPRRGLSRKSRDQDCVSLLLQWSA